MTARHHVIDSFCLLQAVLNHFEIRLYTYILQIGHACLFLSSVLKRVIRIKLQTIDNDKTSCLIFGLWCQPRFVLLNKTKIGTAIGHHFLAQFMQCDAIAFGVFLARLPIFCFIK
jgi:hypothetical protein